MRGKARMKTSRKAKITTIEGLAVAMAEGFAAVEDRFDHLEAKFDAFASEVKDLDRRLAAENQGLLIG